MSAPPRVLGVALRSAVALLALLGGATRARAEESRGLELTWTVPDGCAGKAQVLAEIERLLGSDRALREGAPLSAVAEIRRLERRFVLELRFPAQGSELVRQIESESCEELDEAAALVLALSLDPNNPRLASAALPGSVTVASATTASESATPPAPAAPAAPATPSPPPAPVVAAPNEPKPEPAEPSSSSAAVRFVPPYASLRIAFDLGTLPSLAVGGVLDATVAVEPVTLSVAAALFYPQDETRDGAGGTFHYAALSALPCWRLALGRMDILPCGLLEADFIFASGEGVDQPEQPFTWFPRLGLGVKLDYALAARFALVLDLLGFVTPARPRFVVQDDIELFRPSAVGARFSAGFAVGF